MAHRETTMATDPEARIRAYFADCGHGDAAAIAAHFTDGAVIYDTNVPPVRGSEAIGRFWVRVREKWGGATWQVDAVLVDGERAAIEWTMHGRQPAGGEPFAVRGAEWYRFEAGRIAEIRQYWTFDPASPGTGLVGYPYDR
jgi:ketosteroid isomerase-like protein